MGVQGLDDEARCKCDKEELFSLQGGFEQADGDAAVGVQEEEQRRKDARDLMLMILESETSFLSLRHIQPGELDL